MPVTEVSRGKAEFRLTSPKGSLMSAGRVLMRRIFAMGVLMALTGVALGQSLGDVARQTRQKEKAHAKAPKKVIYERGHSGEPHPASGPARGWREDGPSFGLRRLSRSSLRSGMAEH